MGQLVEWLTPNYAYSVHYTRKLADHNTGLQQLEVLSTPDFGNVLRLDGALQCSEADEFFYHEPLVHVPAMQHAAPRRALVIGGGDGGAAEELLKHPGIQEVVMVEIDVQVIEAAAEFLRSVNGGLFDGGNAVDARFRWQAGDGLAFMRSDSRLYDLIVLDLTDPGGASTALYSAEFYRLCRERLAPGGILSLHVAAPWAQRERAAAIIGRLHGVFGSVTPYLASVPLSGGAWLMAHCAAEPAAPPHIEVLAARCAALRGAPLQYYTPQLHGACAVLPAYLANALNAPSIQQRSPHGNRLP